MKLERFKITGVNARGLVKSGGAVNTKGGLTITKGGCGLKSCHCSDGYSITLTLPRNRLGVVEGIICKFDKYGAGMFDQEETKQLCEVLNI